MVKDGTKCSDSPYDICINGHCKKIGCDWKLDSDSFEDKCGTCNGDNTLCKTVNRIYTRPVETQGYEDLMIVPAGAMHIEVKYLKASDNYLALRKAGNGVYLLNGYWFIQTSESYKVVGTRMFYENERGKSSIKIHGPIRESVVIVGLFMGENLGITMTYTVRKDSVTDQMLDYKWKFKTWSACSNRCGNGTRKSEATCHDKNNVILDDSKCSHMLKPHDIKDSCFLQECVPMWQQGDWSKCSASCGNRRIKYRRVSCTISNGLNQVLVRNGSKDYCIGKKPKDMAKCAIKRCPRFAQWKTSTWDMECQKIDRCSYRLRNVTCAKTPLKRRCNYRTKPVERVWCHKNVKCSLWKDYGWSKCSTTCGPGKKYGRYYCTGNCSKSRKKFLVENCNLRNPCYSASEKYAWVPSMFGRCNSTCGKTYKYRTVSCLDIKLRNEVKSENCDPLKKPKMKRKCSYLKCHKYTIGKWSECSKTCGEGIITRTVSCPNRKCDPNTIPESKHSCRKKVCTKKQWSVSGWKKCSVTCGPGYQTRSVRCVETNSRRSAVDCDTERELASWRRCETRACPTLALEECSDSVSFCSTLKDNCKLAQVKKICCKTCK